MSSAVVENERWARERERRREGLRQIHAWLASWSEIARSVVTRRDHLIHLGLAKRRASKVTKNAA
jgi:hypothetical protein